MRENLGGKIMEKKLLISISPYVQKYYINEEFKDLPEEIKETLRAKLAVIAEKTHAIISLGFSEDMAVYLSYQYEDLSYTDEIGMELRLKKFQQDEAQLIQAIKMWYMIYHTPNGEIVREIVTLQRENKAKEEIKKEILEKYGNDYQGFLEVLLEEE